MKCNSATRLLSGLALAATLASTAAIAAPAAVVVVAPGSSWEYSGVATPGWNTTTGGWSVGAAPFGNTSGGDFGANTNWSANTLLWVRKAVDFTGFNTATAHWDLGVDNGFDLYVNGTHIAGANAEGFTSRWEYSGALGGLHSGVNIIAVALEDHGGATAFDMQILAAPVPEPETYAMMLAGLGLLGLAARRRQAKQK